MYSPWMVSRFVTSSLFSLVRSVWSLWVLVSISLSPLDVSMRCPLQAWCSSLWIVFGQILRFRANCEFSPAWFSVHICSDVCWGLGWPRLLRYCDLPNYFLFLRPLLVTASTLVLSQTVLAFHPYRSWRFSRFIPVWFHLVCLHDFSKCNISVDFASRFIFRWTIHGISCGYLSRSRISSLECL